VERNKGGCGCGYGFGRKFGFNISYSFNTNCGYSPFQSTNDLYSKLKFKLTLGSVFYKL